MSGHILVLANSHSLVFLLNSRLGHFSAASSRRLPFSRSYRVILPSSLAADHSSALVCSTGPPVSVCGTGSIRICLEVFLGSMVRRIEGAGAPPYSRFRHWGRICLPPVYLQPSASMRLARSAFTPSSLLRSWRRSRNINRIPFGAPFRVVLRSRLTPVRLTLTGNPWSCGVDVSRIHYRYLCLHLLFRMLQQPSQATFSAIRNAPLPKNQVLGTASAVCLTPAYYPRPTARLVSCYALFR